MIQLKLAATELLTVITALGCFAESLMVESTLNRRGLSRRDLMFEFESKIGLIASISPFKQPTGMIARETITSTTCCGSTSNSYSDIISRP